VIRKFGVAVLSLAAVWLPAIAMDGSGMGGSDVIHLEADVNNGGFDQYLLNKGRRRARQALAALQSIGARRTAALLEAALEPKATPEELDALDRRFYREPEDLALAMMRYLGTAPATSRARRSSPS